jgi:RNA polymerase sigma-70 factor (ECF subfamily)
VDTASSPSHEYDDAALVARAQAGERGAFSMLVRRHQAAVYRVCYRVLGEPEDAADATQEAFIRAYRKLDTFAGRSAFRTWLLRLAINVSLNERGRRKHEVVLEEAYAAPLPGPEEEVLRLEAVAHVHQALQALTPQHRAAVVLRDLEGLSYGEAALVLGVPEGTVKGWAYRGRERLKDLLQ